MKKFCLIVSFCLCLGFSLFARAQTTDVVGQYNQALQAYAEKNYVEAKSLFQKLLQDHPDNGGLLYDLGNVSLAMGHSGEAIQNYQKAVRVTPRLKGLRENLTIAQTKLGAVEQRSLRGYLSGTFYFWTTWLTVQELRLLFAAFSFVFWGYFLLLFLKKKRLTTLKNFLFILIVVYCAGAVFLKTQAAKSGRFAIVLQPTVDVTASFVDDNPIFQIQEGSEVQILESKTLEQNDQKKTWMRVMTPNGQKGWVQESQVGVI